MSQNHVDRFHLWILRPALHSSGPEEIRRACVPISPDLHGLFVIESGPIHGPNDIIFEWMPYNQLNDIKEINNVLYLAIWKDGPLYYCHHKKEYVRKSKNEKIIIFSCLYDLPIITSEFYDKVISYSFSDDIQIHGISQNPNTKEYFIVFQEKNVVKNIQM
uniref:Uncharacterized protein n=1 Tax=Rhizophagus irregularis (strain DAOM 181602 / DAOM 197198 / MUCL 43194) TaxID=747089 RepID=U9SMN2_RHIID